MKEVRTKLESNSNTTPEIKTTEFGAMLKRSWASSAASMLQKRKSAFSGSLHLPSTSSCLLQAPPSSSHFVKRLKNDFVPMKEWDFQKEYNKYGRGERFGATPDKWDYYNNIVWPPNYETPDGKTIQPEVYHMRENIKYSPKKMWIICHLIRNMTLDEALKQLHFQHRKGATIAAEVLQEARQKAISDHNIEFASNLYIADAQSKQSMIIKGVRRHARARWGIVKYRYCHLYVQLKEGEPAPHKGRFPEKSGWDKMDDYVNWMRERRIKYPL